MTGPRTFGIGALSRRTGCSIDTIRYYERTRLMPTVPRTAGGHRTYTDAHARRIMFVRRARQLGLSLRQVRELLDGTEQNRCSCSAVRSLLRDRLAAVRSRIRDLQGLESDLSTMIDECGDAELMNCRIFEAMLADDGGLPEKRCCEHPSS